MWRLVVIAESVINIEINFSTQISFQDDFKRNKEFVKRFTCDCTISFYLQNAHTPFLGTPGGPCPTPTPSPASRPCAPQ